MNRYAGILLFQYRKDCNEKAAQRRLCEERTILTSASSAKAAVGKLERRGQSVQCNYDSGGGRVFIEFIGLRELIELGPEADADEVWWGFFEAVRPKENRDKWIPKHADLRAFSVGKERAIRRKNRQAKRRRKPSDS